MQNKFMNQQQKRWEKEQKRRQAKKERAAEAFSHAETQGSTSANTSMRARETPVANTTPVKMAKHQTPVKPVHKQGTQRGS
jgi:hypothetical protein